MFPRKSVSAQQRTTRPVAYKHYLLSILLVILAFNYVDRLALGLLLQDIKVELVLSDTQLGFLSGIAFAAFYAVMGIPIARWADRGDRVAIIATTTAIWSAAVALCGLAGNFIQLLMIRVAVAVGEAGCVPPAHSLIADHFTRAERPRAVARYMLGVPLSLVIGYFVAGWLNELYGWRATFIMMGLPGLALAAIAWFTLREPRRGSGTNSLLGAVLAQSSSAKSPTQPSLRDVCVTLWTNQTFRHLLFSFAVSSFFISGIAQWKPAFFIRRFELQTGELGTWLALVYGIGGVFGTYIGGEFAARYAARNERLQLKVMAVAYSAAGLISAGVYLVSDYHVAFGLMCFALVGTAATNGPLFAMIQTLVPDRMRAISIAIVYLFANLIGMGLGPLAVGALSDAFRPWAGDHSLGYALLALCPGYLWCAWHLLFASRTVTQCLASIPEERGEAVSERDDPMHVAEEYRGMDRTIFHSK